MERITDVQKHINKLKLEGRLNALGVGNAIVDCIVHASEELLDELGLHKSVMTLVSENEIPTFEELTKTSEAALNAGGSIANTLATMGIFGVPSLFCGNVAEDDFGRFFVDDLNNFQVKYCGATTQGKKTGRSYIFVTPDGQRTMATYLGVAKEITKSDLEKIDFSQIGLFLLEAYLFDSPSFAPLVIELAQEVRSAGALFVLSTSDTFVVKRHINLFKELISKQLVDILFANNEEILSLTEIDDVEKSVILLKEQLDSVVVTCGEDGCMLYIAENYYNVPTNKIHSPVDTTGAGDSFMGAFLAGLINGLDVQKCAHLANEVAGSVISQRGARPDKSINQLLAKYK